MGTRITRKRAQLRKRVLAEARALLAQPHKWAKGAFVKDTAYGPAYCMIGAVRKVTDDLSSGGMFEEIEGVDKYTIRADCDAVMRRCIREFGFSHVPNFNDAKQIRKADVLKAMDCAVEKAADVTV